MESVMSDTSTNAYIVLPCHLAGKLQPKLASQLGNAEVFASLLPQIYGNAASLNKQRQPLEKVDHYMRKETTELLRRLVVFCRQLEIDEGIEFQVKYQPEGLRVIGDFVARGALAQLLNADKWFVGSFKWLQPSYTSLAHSFEMLDYSYYYQLSPLAAKQRYCHFSKDDNGLAFALNHAQGNVSAQVESPLNLYSV
jgi:hypothetical protein